jgi:glycosyltransferase involved in cell wall biosynthesis
VRFLLLNQFYPPDGAPTGQMLHDLGKTLVARGHDVSVICSRLGYDGRRQGPAAASTAVFEGIEVLRTGGSPFRRGTLIGRILAYATFIAGALRAALAGRTPDRVISLTTPPFLGIAGNLVARLRRSRHVPWIMDVYPDALRAHWGMAESTLLWTLLQWLGRAQFDGAALVLAPGSRVEERLRRYVPEHTALRSVPLWATETHRADALAVEGERRSRGWRVDDLILMYSGNMGLGHRFVEFLETARRQAPSGPRWVFVGDGPRRSEIEAFRAANPSSRVELLPYVDRPRLACSLASADVHLVSVAPGWEGVMVPSKLQNVFAAGRPAIFLGSDETEVARWIRDSGGGWVVAPGDLASLLRAVEEAGDAVDRARRGEAAREYADRHFDRARNCERIAILLEQA